MNILTCVSALIIIFNSLISSVLSHTCVCAQFTATQCNAEPNCCWNEKVPKNNGIGGFSGKCRSVRYLTCKADEKCDIKYVKLAQTGGTQSLFVENKVNELVSAYNRLNQLDNGNYEMDNGQDPTESRVMDWPWTCAEEDKKIQYEGDKEELCAKFREKDSNWMGGDSEELMGSSSAEDVFYADDNDYGDAEYAADPVDVSQIEIAAQRLYYAKLGMDNIEEKAENNITSKPGATYESMTGLQIGAGIVFIVLLFGGMCYWQCNKDKMDKDDKFISLSDGNTKGTYATF